jgi:hypothetical protein
MQNKSAAIVTGVQGQGTKGGHFFPEESPNDTAALVDRFLAS